MFNAVRFEVARKRRCYNKSDLAVNIFPQLFKLLRDDGYTKSDIAEELQFNVEEIDKLVFGLILVALEGGGQSGRRKNKPNLQLITK